MSADDSGPVASREVAYRLFAAEFDDADLEYSDSDEERAPNYVITPTGARVNRLFAVGVLTAVEPVSDDVLRARVVDPTGAFVVYAGQYQPEAVAFLEAADVPSFVAVTGKARTFQPDGSDRVFTSVRPESMTSVDAATRDRWTVQAAEHTLARVATMAHALDRDERGDALTGSLEAAGVEPGLAAGTALAIDHYGTSRAYLAALREVAVAATEVVAGAREAVPDLEIDPDGDGPVEADLTAAPAVPGTITADGDEGLGAEPAGTDAVAEALGDDAAQSAEPEPEPDVAAADTAVSDAPDPGADEADVAPEAPAPGPEDPTQTDESAEPASATDDLGDFEADGVDAAAPDDEGGDEPYELDEAEREAVEAEYGTEFSTGSEVGEPGEAGIETETAPPATESAGPPDDSPDAAEPPVDDAESASDESPATDASSDDAPEAGVEGADPEAAPADLEDAVVAAMADLDEGDGAAHDAVVDAVVDAHGVDAEAVEAAIEEALMSGLCYEPTDDRLKAI